MKFAIVAIVLAVAGFFTLRTMQHVARGIDAVQPYNFSMKPRYTAEDLQGIATKHPDDARKYVRSILLGLDLIFLICLGGAAACFAYAIAPHTGLEAKDFWLLLIFPVAYMLCDLTENLLLSWALSGGEMITDRFVMLIKTLTWLKHGFVVLGGLQVVVLAVLWVCRCLRA